MQYLVVELATIGRSGPSWTASLAFESADAAEDALDALRRSGGYQVEITSDRGEFLCLRREYIVGAYLAGEEPPPLESGGGTSSAQIDRLRDVLGVPVYDGPSSLRVHADRRTERVTTGVSQDRLLLWQCGDPPEAVCAAQLREDGWQYAPCSRHRDLRRSC